MADRPVTLKLLVVITRREWCPGMELNHRHRDFQSPALPPELPGRRLPQSGCLHRKNQRRCPARQVRALARSVQSTSLVVMASVFGPSAVGCRIRIVLSVSPRRKLIFKRILDRNAVTLQEPSTQIDLLAAQRAERSKLRSCRCTADWTRFHRHGQTYSITISNPFCLASGRSTSGCPSRRPVSTSAAESGPSSVAITSVDASRTGLPPGPRVRRTPRSAAHASASGLGAGAWFKLKNQQVQVRGADV